MALLFIKTQTCTHTRTQVNIEQELLHEKLNYLNTQKRQQITLN